MKIFRTQKDFGESASLNCILVRELRARESQVSDQSPRPSMTLAEIAMSEFPSSLEMPLPWLHASVPSFLSSFLIEGLYL